MNPPPPDRRAPSGAGVDPPAPKRPKERREARPRRLRRWVVRPLIWFGLLVLLASAALVLSLQTSFVEARARAFLVARLSEALESPVDVDRVRLGVMPLSVDVEGLKLQGEGDGRPFLEVKSARVTARVLGWGRPEVRVEQVDIVEPKVYVELREDGGTNLPRPRATGGGQRGLRWRIGTLNVSQGEAELGELRIPLNLQAREIWCLLEGQGEGLDLAGRVTTEDVAFQLRDGPVFPLRASVGLALTEGRLAFDEARVSGPDLRAEATGQLLWGRSLPRLTLDVQAVGDAGVVNALGLSETRLTGEVNTTGRLEVAGPNWDYHGAAGAPRLEADGRVLTAVSSQIAASGERVTVEITSARYAGGAVLGTVVATTGADPMVDLDLELSGLNPRRVVADSLTGDRRQRVDSVLASIASRISGPVRYRFRPDASRLGTGEVELRWTAADPQAGQLGLEGIVPLRLDEGVVTGGAGQLSTPDQRLVIEGLEVDLASGQGSLDYLLDSDRLDEWKAFLPAESRRSADDYLPLAGSGEVRGAVEFNRPGEDPLAVSAALDLRAVEAPRYALDWVSGLVNVFEDRVEIQRLETARGEGALLVSGVIPFPEGSAGGAGANQPGLPVGSRLSVDADSWPLAELASFLPERLSPSGAASVHLTMNGGQEGLSGSGHLSVADLVLAGDPIGLLRVEELELTPDEVRFPSAYAETQAGLFLLGGRVGLGDAPELDLSWEGNGLAIDQEPFRHWIGERLSGRLALRGTARGPAAAPRLESRVELVEASLGGRPLGPSSLEATWDGARLDVNGRLGDILDLQGGGALSSLEADLDFDLVAEDLGRARQLFPAELAPRLAAWNGRFEGRARLNGPLASPEGLLELTGVRLSYGARRISNLEPVVLRLADGVLALETLYLGQDEAADGAEAQDTVFATGTLSLVDEGALDLRIASELAARWVEPLLPGVRRLRGRLNGLARIEGRLDEPRFDGQVGLEGGALLLDGFPQGIQELDGLALVYPDRLVLDRLEGRLGGGTVEAAGNLDLSGGCCSVYAFQGSAQGVRLLYPTDWSIAGDARLSLSPQADGILLRGDVDLQRAAYLRDLDINPLQVLAGFLRRKRIEASLPDPALEPVELSIAVRGDEALRVRNNVADIRATTDLQILGTLARPTVLGDIDLSPEGTFELGGNEYSVDRGRLTFARRDRINPFIDVVATSQVSDYDIVLNLSGTLEDPQAEFVSDPPLSKLGVLELVATGEVGGRISELGAGTGFGGTGAGTGAGTNGAGTGAGVGDWAQRYLAGEAASLVTERVRRLFRFDKLRVEPTSSAGESISSARISLGKQISRDLYVTYTGGPAANQQEIVQAEWRVLPGVTLVFTVTDGDTYAVDVRLDQRF